MILMVTNKEYEHALARCRAEGRAIFSIDVTHDGYELKVSDDSVLCYTEQDLIPHRRMVGTETPGESR